MNSASVISHHGVHRLVVVGGLAAILVAGVGCARTTPVATSAAPTLCPASSRLLFSPAIADDAAPDGLFVVFGALALPDGTALVSYDPNTPEAGDDTGTRGSPRLVSVTPDGDVTEVSLPRLNGVPVSVTAVPLVADGAGTAYLYDAASSRVVARAAGDRWRVVLGLDNTLVFRAPQAGLGPDGSLYLATASQLIRVGPDQQPHVLAGRKQVPSGEVVFPQEAVGALPVAATSVTLPAATSIVVDQQSVVHFSTADSLYTVSPDGQLDSETRAGPTITPPAGFGRTNLTGLALSDDGSLLAADSGNQTVFRVRPDGGMDVFADNVRFISAGVVGSRPGTGHLLLIDSDQQVVCSV